MCVFFSPFFCKSLSLPDFVSLFAIAIRTQFFIPCHSNAPSWRSTNRGRCLSHPQVSPCKKKSLLPACLRGRVPSDENVYTKTSSAAPSAHASPAHRKHQHEHDQIDYEDDSYFKRRPKTICYTDPKRLASFDDSLGRVSGRRPGEGVMWGIGTEGGHLGHGHRGHLEHWPSGHNRLLDHWRKRTRRH